MFHADKVILRLVHILLMVGFSTLTCHSQERDYNGSSFSAGVSYLELKDELNHGLVFRGPDLRLYYGYEKIDSNGYFNYQLSLGGGGKTTNGTWGFAWYLSPLDVHYSWSIGNSGKSKWYLGPSFRIQYNVQNYPDLHAGPIIWLTNMELGFHLSAFIKVKEKLIELKLRNSLVSLNSRTPAERDPYYFSTSIADNLSDLHSNMSLSTFNEYNQTELSAFLYLNGGNMIKSLGYKFNFSGYFPEPSFVQIYHQFCFTWYFKGSKL